MVWWSGGLVCVETFSPFVNFVNFLCLYYWFIIPGGQAHKRRRTSEPIEIEDRLESLICRVGEKVKCQLHQSISHRNLTQYYLYQHFNKCTLQALNDYVSFQSTSSLESNLEGLAGVLEADLPNYKNKILRILCSV